MGTPVGTSTLYVQMEEPVQNIETIENLTEEEWYDYLKQQTLIKERRRLNRATESNESLFVQYMVSGGYKNLDYDFNNRPIYRVSSNTHAGTGQLVWGLTSHQKCDLTLFFKKQNKIPALITFINYHGSYYHYNGHCDNCPSGLQTDSEFEPKAKDIFFDAFRKQLALVFSTVHSENVRFIYHICYECNYFHGNGSLMLNNQTFSTIIEAVKTNPEHIYSKRYGQFYNVNRLLEKIRKKEVEGFITIKGREGYTNDANDFFGYCVQRYKPTFEQLSSLTIDQLKYFKNLNSNEEIKNYLTNHQIGLTLNSGSFHSEETITTGDLCWLMENRQFSNFQITHFIEYKMTNFAKTFIEPLLEQRHFAKQRGDTISAECLKLLCNGSFGYNALESSNYNSCRLITASNLQKNKSTIPAFLSLDNIQIIGIVKKTTKSNKKDNNDDDKDGIL